MQNTNPYLTPQEIDGAYMKLHSWGFDENMAWYILGDLHSHDVKATITSKRISLFRKVYCVWVHPSYKDIPFTEMGDRVQYKKITHYPYWECVIIPHESLEPKII